MLVKRKKKDVKFILVVIVKPDTSKILSFNM